LIPKQEMIVNKKNNGTNGEHICVQMNICLGNNQYNYY
jgi:hypothetical protein